jgi:hypothetical protein
VEEHMNGYCVSYPSYGNCVCSAIEHDYSYGHTVNMIEIEGLLTKKEREIDSVCGYLSAEDVFERIKNHYDMSRKEKTS